MCCPKNVYPEGFLYTIFIGRTGAAATSCDENMPAIPACKVIRSLKFFRAMIGLACVASVPAGGMRLVGFDLDVARAVGSMNDIATLYAFKRRTGAAIGRFPDDL
jgi:ABC-type amino acid transport substrate-binding protein